MKGFKLLVSLNLGVSICIFIGLLILMKNKFNMLKCATKISKKRFKRNPSEKHVPSKSEIELQSKQSYISLTDDDE